MWKKGGGGGKKDSTFTIAPSKRLSSIWRQLAECCLNTPKVCVAFNFQLPAWPKIASGFRSAYISRRGRGLRWRAANCSLWRPCELCGLATVLRCDAHFSAYPVVLPRIDAGGWTCHAWIAPTHASLTLCRSVCNSNHASLAACCLLVPHLVPLLPFLDSLPC